LKATRLQGVRALRTKTGSKLVLSCAFALAERLSLNFG
jgi:hypothetical protein